MALRLKQTANGFIGWKSKTKTVPKLWTKNGNIEQDGKSEQDGNIEQDGNSEQDGNKGTSVMQIGFGLLD